VPIVPSDFDKHTPFELLTEAESGRIGFDHRLLQTLISRPEQTLPDLVRFASEIREDRLLDLDEQAFDLFRHFNTAAAIPCYLHRLTQAEDGIPDELVEAFAALGAPAVEPLLAAIEAAGPDDKGDLVFLLAALGVRDARIPELLETVLAVDPYEGALCVGLYGDPALKPLVQDALSELPAGDDAQQERKALEDCLAQLEAGEVAHDLPAFELLKLYSETASPLFESLPEDQIEEYLACDFVEYRVDAALSLCDEQYNEDTRDALLRSAKDDAEPEVRAACLRALGSALQTTGKGDPEVQEFLLERLDNTELTLAERASAMVALAQETGNSAVHDAIHALYEVPAVRADAIEAMWRSHDARYRKYFAENLQHEDPRVRGNAVVGVGAFPIPELAIDLIPLFDDEETRQQALFSYALAVPGKTSAKSVLKMFEKIEELAGSFEGADGETVAGALDTRLDREGLPPVFFPDDEAHEHVHGPDCGHDHENDNGATAPPAEPVAAAKIGRNDPCPCGSGKKFKKCHGAAN
jgi:hypothetical protein